MRTRADVERDLKLAAQMCEDIALDFKAAQFALTKAKEDFNTVNEAANAAVKRYDNLRDEFRALAK